MKKTPSFSSPIRYKHDFEPESNPTVQMNNISSAEWATCTISLSSEHIRNWEASCSQLSNQLSPRITLINFLVAILELQSSLPLFRWHI